MFQNSRFRVVYKMDTIYSEYLMTFRKFLKDDSVPQYEIDVTVSNEMESDYAYDEYTVWTGTEGPLAEFIEEALDNYESEIKAKEYEKPVFSSNETKAVPKDVPMYVEKPIIESKEPKGPGIQEELIRYVLENTKTVDLLDEFEGLTGEKKAVPQNRSKKHHVS